MRTRLMATQLILFPITLALGCTATISPQEQNSFLPAPATVVKAATVETPAELATIRPALVEAWRGSEPAALRAYFRDDAIVVTPTSQFIGWWEIHNNWIVPTLPNVREFTASPTSFMRDGERIIEKGSYSYTLMHGGTAHPISGFYTYRWQPGDDGTWRIASVKLK